MAEPELRGMLKKPDPFSGQPHEDPIAWMRKFELIRDVQRMGDRTAIQVAGLFFSSLAEAWYYRNQDSFADWATFKAMYEEQFVSPARKEAWWTELTNMRQKEGQTVDELAASISELASRVGLKDDEVKIRYFLKALKSEIAEHVARAHRKTWNEVLEQARLEQAIRSVYHGDEPREDRAPVIPPAPAPARSTGMNDGMDRLMQQFEKLSVNLVTALTAAIPKTQPYAARTAGPGRCYTCGNEGHKAYMCPDNRRNTASPVNGHGTMEMPPQDRRADQGKAYGRQ